MKIQILGTGCPNCKRLEANAQEAVKLSGISAEIEKVTDLDKIMGFGVMTTPALVIDGKVVAAGKLPTLADIKKMIGGN